MAASNKAPMLKRLKDAFDEFDKNGDGRICKVELRALMEKAGLQPNEKRVEVGTFPQITLGVPLHYNTVHYNIVYIIEPTLYYS